MLTGRTILVVEDDTDARAAMLSHRLGEDFGVPVAAAGTLQEAETLLSDESVCIGAVTLDVGMPDGDGCDFCARMRREGHKMPIIVPHRLISAYSRAAKMLPSQLALTFSTPRKSCYKIRSPKDVSG